MKQENQTHIRQEQNSRVSAIEQEPLKYVALALTHLRNEFAKLPRMIEDQSRPVDEYVSQEVIDATVQSPLTILPQWEVSEKITSIVVSGPTFALTPVSTPAVPASTVGVQNPNNYPVSVVITGGTVSNVVINGYTNAAGATDGTYIVPAYGTIAVTYSAAPTWAWSGINNALATLQLGDRQWPLVMPPTGIIVISPVAVLLGRSDVRQLTFSVPGIWSVELMGYCDTRNEMI